MYNIKLNNYHLKPKPSNIQTPPEVSQFIFELLKDKIPSDTLILDPCCGQGSLLQPWVESNNYPIHGIDLVKSCYTNQVRDFLTWDGKPPYGRPHENNLILCNPPFKSYGHKLGSEVWLDKIIELFGKEIPIVLFAPVGFAPVGFCANLTLNNKRHEKFENGTYPPISSRITLPKNIFEGVVFHSEILIFNLQGLKSHYFLPKNHEQSN